jgi:hypothetical protein
MIRRRHTKIEVARRGIQKLQPVEQPIDNGGWNSLIVSVPQVEIPQPVVAEADDHV